MSLVFLWCVVDNGNRHARATALAWDGITEPERVAILKASSKQRWDMLDRLILVDRVPASTLAGRCPPGCDWPGGPPCPTHSTQAERDAAIEAALATVSRANECAALDLDDRSA